MSGLIFSVYNREDISFTVLRGKDTPYSIVKDSDNNDVIINHFKLHIKNQTFEDRTLNFALPESSVKDNIQLVSQNKFVDIEAGKDKTVHFFVKFPPTIMSEEGVKSISILLNDSDNNKYIEKVIKLVGPKST